MADSFSSTLSKLQYKGPTAPSNTLPEGMKQWGVPQASVPKIAPTQSGGVAFDPSMTSGFKATVQPATPQNTASKSLADFVSSSSPTANGGMVTTTGNGANVTGYTPSSGFSIDTSGAVPSNALTSHTAMGDLNTRRNQYADYVNGLAQAQGYSPEYIQALQAQQQAATQAASLGLNQAALNSNYYTGNNLPGDTQNYAQGATAKAQAQNTLQQAQNSIAQLSANQQMQVQALIRSGNIAAAQSLVSAYAPVGVSPGTSLVSPVTGQESYSGLGGLTGVNAANQFNSLQSSYPDANIPPYDPKLTPAQNQQVAMKAVQSAPSFQSATPEGQANISSLVQQQGYLDTTNRAYETATSNLGTLQTFMGQNGLNDQDVPIINQINNKIKSKLLDPGVVGAFQSSLSGLRQEYSQVLSRGGDRSVETDNVAKSLIPDNLSPAQLAIVTKQLSLEGQNAIREAQNQVNTIKNRIPGGTNAMVSNGNAASSPNTATVGNTNFQFVNGKWVVSK